MYNIRPKIVIRQFRLPDDEVSLNTIMNKLNISIIDEKVFQDKGGDLVIYLKYEDYNVSNPLILN